MPDANFNNASKVAPSKGWKRASVNPQVARISNPIREIISGIDLSSPPQEGVDKPLINLGIGDPSVYGNFPPAPESIAAIRDSLEGLKSLGYPESIGYTDAREAVANYYDEGPGRNFRPTKNDVVMTHGCSGALEMAISVLCSEGQNMLVSRPLFTAYEAMAAVSGVELRYYDLLPEQGWECDLESIDALIDENTACIILNNPGNPCGSNYSVAHLEAFAQLMERRKVVVIADEVYAGLAWDVTGPRPASADAPRVEGKFNPGVFTSYASVCGDAPVLVVGAVSKRWLAPGWRLGWIMVHDPQGVFADVRVGMGKYSFRIQGPNSTMQRALPALLANTPEKFYTDTMDKLRKTGVALHARLSKIKGLKPLLPQGAMYLMTGGLENFEFENDKAFIEALHEEERVFILPGACFRLDGYMRFVTTTPLPILLQACDRIEAFCNRHRKTIA
ncbi:uncharacterized protein JCM15063_005750 [Sporobolomyces koalae]|uniref:uncharacterized protein n=1 Tax=Sporobolomyces koalae TaxID=500713 RepID=UPI00317EB408